MRAQMILGTALLLLLVSCGPAQNDSQRVTAGARQVKGDAAPGRDSNAIGHFWFSYPYQPQPGLRVWINIGETNWVEVYPDGSQSRYRVLGRETVDGMSGVIVSKTAGDQQVTETLNDGSFQAFLPDRNSAKVVLYFRNRIGGQWQPWRALAQVNPIE